MTDSRPGTAAAGWEANAEQTDARLLPVTNWFVEQTDVQAGTVVLDLAAGPGGVGFHFAGLVGESGRVLSTDLAPAMLDAARRVGARRGLSNVDYRLIDAQDMDLDDDSVDIVVCRSGFMLMPDPLAALRESKRVLRPGGDLVFSVFGPPERNPFVGVPPRVFTELGHLSPPPPGTPGVFALSDPELIRALLDEADFDPRTVEAIHLEGGFPNADSIVDRILEMNAHIGPIHRDLPSSDQAAARRALREGFDAYRQSDGTYVLPAQMWGAHAR